MSTITHTITLQGIEPQLITCEMDVTPGYGIHVTGMDDLSLKECLLRSVTALQACGYAVPGRRIEITLRPSELRKVGPRYDLAIASLLVSASRPFGDSRPLDTSRLERFILVGELALDGGLRAVNGALQAVKAFREGDFQGVILPEANLQEIADAFPGESLEGVYPVSTLHEAFKVINGDVEGLSVEDELETSPCNDEQHSVSSYHRLPEGAQRVAEIAAAGGHHLLVVGAAFRTEPLARTVRELLPPLGRDDALTNALLYSTLGPDSHPIRGERPFRMPHYGSSLRALFGGGSGSDTLAPGEMSLANKGVLFIGDINLMPRSVKDAMRGPIEDREIVLSRLRTRVRYPSDFLLVGSMEPCPCGRYGTGEECRCTPAAREEYMAKTTGSPLFEHFGLHFWADGQQRPNEQGDLNGAQARVSRARALQAERYAGTAYKTNNDVMSRDADTYFHIDEDCKTLLENLILHMGLSARCYSWILRIARTIADLDGSEEILGKHLAEAASFQFINKVPSEQ